MCVCGCVGGEGVVVVGVHVVVLLSLSKGKQGLKRTGDFRGRGRGGEMVGSF